MSVTSVLDKPATAAPLPTTAAAQRCVVVHSGARDAYQLALALEEAGMLEALVTDLFWPSTRTWAKTLASILPNRALTLLKQRSAPGLPASKVHQCIGSGFATLLLDKLPGMPLALRRRAARHADSTLGRTAGMLATRTRAGLLSYSYYGFAAFSHYDRAGILFQLHPHPLSMRRILTEELQAHPECAASLQQEWELSLPEEDFNRLVAETAMPAHILAASSFTRSTLVENGTPASAVSVIPYGVDCTRYRPDQTRRGSQQAPLRLLFVGRINQRKGIKYLLEALRLLDTTQVHLTVCGRVVDGLDLFKPFAAQVDVRPSVSAADLVQAYQAADLFVFPSVAEGFGQVLLEALACGLPILSTTHTAAPDLIEDGNEGFIVAPRRPDHLAERIEWALTHRPELQAMGNQARLQAERFTWDRFRAGVVDAVRAAQAKPEPEPEPRYV